MSFIRTVKKESPFVQLDKYFLEDDNLSFEAKGLLAYVLSKPDKWKIRKTDLIKKSKSGRTRIESALLELMSSGYMNWYQEREEGGVFGEWIYNVYERPEFNPEADSCIKEGLDRINARKTVNKQKNKAKLQPKADNPLSDSPKAGYPKADYPKADNLPSSNNDLRDIELSNNELKEEEEAAADSAFNSFKKHIDPKATDAIKDEFKKWASLLPLEIMLNEIKYAAKNGAKSFAYLEKSYTQDLAQGVDTIEKLENKRLQYAASKKKPSSVKKSHVREEVLPDWFKDREKPENSAEGLTSGNSEEFEKEKAEFLAKMKKRREEMQGKGE